MDVINLIQRLENIDGFVIAGRGGEQFEPIRIYSSNRDIIDREAAPVAVEEEEAAQVAGQTDEVRNVEGANPANPVGGSKRTHKKIRRRTNRKRTNQKIRRTNQKVRRTNGKVRRTNGKVRRTNGKVRRRTNQKVRRTNKKNSKRR